MKLFAEYFKTTYRHLANTFFSLTLLLALLPAGTQAQENEEAENILKGLQQAQIQTYFTINAFYNFSANEGDKSLQVDINEAINEVNTALNGLEQYATVEYIKNDLAISTEKWQLYKTTLNTVINDIADQGYADLRLISDLATQNQDLGKQLAFTYEKAEQQSGYTPNKVTTQSRKAALMMAKMMTMYTARTSSSMSQVFVGGETEKTIDVMASDFDKELKDLHSAAPQEQKKSIDSALTKWDFIKSSYINFFAIFC